MNMLESAEMPSPRASRENLKAYRRRVGLRSPDESWELKQTILGWACSTKTREHKTQRELARAIGINQSYIPKVVRSMFPGGVARSRGAGLGEH